MVHVLALMLSLLGTSQRVHDLTCPSACPGSELFAMIASSMAIGFADGWCTRGGELSEVFFARQIGMVH